MRAGQALKPGYYDRASAEILALVPANAKRILDLGCGTGALGAKLKERQTCSVEGVELNKEAGQAAKQNLDKVWIDNLNRFDPSFLKEQYDCIIFGDILEHLINPWGVLEKFAAVLAPDGCVVASIPNIAHPFNIDQLQKGLFRYRSDGMLDITHLRFFTKTTIFQMFCRAGLKITGCRANPSPEHPMTYLVTAEKPILKHTEPKVTIIVLAYNAWEYTQQCIGSIKAYTHYPYKLIVVDNGSTDNTVRELRQDREIFHIENSCNLGFAGGNNVGLECVHTPFFVLANSDVVVTSGWLSSLVDLMEADPQLAALGSRSNASAGPQSTGNMPYKDEVTLQAFAEAFKKAAPVPLCYVPRISFFLTLFRTGLLSTVGFLDERFETGNFEDDDYCIRISVAKHRIAFTNSVFIHHYGSKTFLHNKIDYGKALEDNRKKLHEKWNLPDPEKTDTTGLT